MNNQQIFNLQTKRLKYVLDQLVPYSPYYRQLFKSHRINLSSITSIKDITKLPFTQKSDLLPTPKEPAKPRSVVLQPTPELVKKTLRMRQKLQFVGSSLVGRSIKERFEHEFRPIHIHSTTGRSTAQIPFLYTKRDLDTLGQTGKRIFDLVGATKEDVVLSAFPYAPHLAFWLGFYAAYAAGVLAFHSGGGKILGTQRIIDAIERLQPTILLFIPGYAYHLLREAASQKRNFSSVKMVIFGGERVSLGFRQKILDLLYNLKANQVKLLATYAFTEGKTAWVQCHERSDYHLYPDKEYIELIDKNGQPVKEGQPGEVVYTALDWRGSMVIRYKTADWCEGLYWSKPCQYCGKGGPRLSYNIERQSDKLALNLTKIKGELINLNTFYTLMHDLPSVEEWQVELTKAGHDKYGLDEINVYVAFRPNVKAGQEIVKLSRIIKNELSVSAKVHQKSLSELVDRLGLEKELKEKRIIDKRPKE